MYVLSRTLLRASAAVLACWVGLIGLFFWPLSGVVAAAAFASWCWRRGRERLTTLGSARWATERELERAGMLTAQRGLILGRIPADRQGYPPVLKLFSGQLTAEQACTEFWGAMKRAHARQVRLPQAIHTAVFSPSGGGKGVSLVLPFLFTCDESAVVIDFKGENALKTARWRREQFGHEIVMLDPFHAVGAYSDGFNPLAEIRPDHPLALDECNDLAKALVVRAPEAKEPHWDDSAEAWIAALAALVVQYADEDLRSLQTLKEFVSHPQRLDSAIKVMCESQAWDGLLARMGGQLLHFVDREKSSTLSTVGRHLRFLDSPAIAACTKRSTFDPARLRNGKMTVYIVLPPERMRAQGAFLRMCIGGLLRAVIRGGLQEAKKVHFVLDEAASLGRMEPLEDAVDKYRGYGVRLQFYYQSLGQLKQCFPDGLDQSLLSNTSQIFFGVNDLPTAEMVSGRLGEETLVVESGGWSSSSSHQNSSGMNPSETTGQTWSQSRNWQQQARKLLKPEEVLGLSPRTALTFTPGLPPIATELLRYYEEPELTQPPSRTKAAWRAVRMLASATTLLLISLGVFVIALGAVALQYGFLPRP